MENRNKRNITYIEYEDILDSKSSKQKNTSSVVPNNVESKTINQEKDNNSSNECYVWEVKEDKKEKESFSNDNQQSSLFEDLDIEATSSLKELQERDHNFNDEEIIEEFNNLEDQSIKWTVEEDNQNMNPLFEQQDNSNNMSFEQLIETINEYDKNNDDDFQDFEIIDEIKEIENDDLINNQESELSNDYFNVFDEKENNTQSSLDENDDDFIIIDDEEQSLENEDYFNIFDEDKCECEDCECEKETNDELIDDNSENDDFILINDEIQDNLEDLDNDQNDLDETIDFDTINDIDEIDNLEELSDLDVDLNDFIEIEGDDILDINEQEDLDLSGLVADNDEDEELFNKELIEQTENKLNSTLEDNSLSAIKEKIKNLEGTLNDVQKHAVYSQDELIKKLNETFNASEDEINSLLKSASMKISFINDVIERAKTKFDDYDSNFLYNIINKIEDAVETFKRNNNLK